MNRVEIKNKAKELIKGNLWTILSRYLIVILITVVISIIPNILGIETEIKTTTDLGIVITSPTTFGSIWSVCTSILSVFLGYGFLCFILKFVRGEVKDYKYMFEVVKEKWQLVLVASILEGIFVGLGFMFLIIPGIIVSLGLSFLLYVIFDDTENLKAMDAIKKTWNMMNNHKMDYFVFSLSFIGWMLLCVFIFPAIYVLPYISVATALYYENIKDSKTTN